MALRGTKATTPTTTHAVVEVVENYIQNQNLLGEIAELDDMLCDLVDMHKDNVLALKRVLQCIYNLLQSNSRWNVKFGQKLFHKLISVIIADSREDSAPQRQLVANVLVCVHLHTKKFRHMDNKFLLYQLWSLNLSSEEQPHAIQILVYLIDDFVDELGVECYGQLATIIQNLLQSSEIEQRKSAYFLMAKLLAIIQRERREGLPEHLLKILQCSEIQWSAYVTLMENLEEQQSHLVLPSLTSLLPRLHTPGGQPQENWVSWLRILYARLLQDNNILVLRWTLNYFLSRFDLGQLIGLNLLDDFLKATNRTQLFNFEGDDSLLKFKMDAFLTDNNLGSLLEHIAKVSWHCVPLHYWLCQINPDKVPKVPKSVLIELSSRVRTLQNPSIRTMAIQRVHKLFKNTIDEFSLTDYMMFIDALYNSYDDFYEYDCLNDKIKECDNIANAIDRFNQRTYEIVCCIPSPLNDFFIGEFLKKLNNLPNSQHGWWRLFPIFRLSENSQVREFYLNKYKLDVSSLAEFNDLKELQSYILDKLHCESKEEKSFVLESCVDYFVERVNEWEMLVNANPMDLLDKGTERTVKHLVKLLCGYDRPLQDNNVLPGLIAKINTKTSSDEIVDLILPYAYKFMDPEEYYGLVSNLIVNHKEILLFDCFTVALFIKLLLHGETSTGDARIEAAYISAINEEIFPDVVLRQMCIPHIKTSLCNEDLYSLCHQLLNINNEMSQKKPRYFENSKEHRIKIRIASSLLQISARRKCFWSEDLWVALLEPSNQLNICYMYEALVANTLPSDDLLFEKLKSLSTLKPTQQVSLISVVYIYCNLHSNILQNRLEDIIDMLLPHTMGAHFQTRLLAQLVLYRLASQRNDLPIAKAVIGSIKVTLGDKLDNLQEREPRLFLPQILYNVNAILYITNTPFDEYYHHHHYDNNLKMLRAAFKAKRKQSDTELSSSVTTTNGNVQRKMNPCCDIYPKDDLATADVPTTDHELIVVASLIDKLPNLGGLARTCEVFGVNTLVIATKSDVDKSDFANISMTAEKTLNIEEVKTVALGEYLIGKQTEGYKIVGAEQTAHSTSFSDFRFPKKCLLLLGHEKHGIPVDLIGFLDYAVEIPQFGMVRSLNVHVTGSLFIWEFCKQHMVKK